MATVSFVLLGLVIGLTMCVGVLSNNAGSTTEDTTQSTTVSITTSTLKTSTVSVPTTPVTTPKVTPEQECAKHSNKCADCIKAADYKCFYCFTDNKCMLYPVGHILPTNLCSLSDARWGICSINFEALIIGMSVVGGIVLLTITICCIKCCCCKGGDRNKYVKEEAKWERQKTERKQRSDDRKADRKQRMDEIRKKYGLMKDDAPYERFDA